MLLAGGGGKAGRRSELLHVSGVTSETPVARALDITKAVGAADPGAAVTQTSLAEEGSLLVCPNRGADGACSGLVGKRWREVPEARLVGAGGGPADLEYSVQVEAPSGDGGVWVTGGGFDEAAAETFVVAGNATAGVSATPFWALPEPLRSHSLVKTATTKKSVYYVLAGGADEAGKVSGRTYLGRWRPQGGRRGTLNWWPMGNLTWPRYNHFSFLHGDLVYVCGGMAASAPGGSVPRPVAGCETLDLVVKDGRWGSAPVGGPPDPVASPGLLEHKGTVLALGGWGWTGSSWRQSDAVLAFDGRAFRRAAGRLATPRVGGHAVKADLLGMHFPKKLLPN